MNMILYGRPPLVFDPPGAATQTSPLIPDSTPLESLEPGSIDGDQGDAGGGGDIDLDAGQIDAEILQQREGDIGHAVVADATDQGDFGA